ncbi:(S)-ureidoglycine aminohydrolase [Silvibacterium bohemicum]|uniref:(S)-ureidoglycine aminohydrolase n=1 Tax=Silvibacterium bohemicum TaxID=1577686 RepID=A0A841K794_9BACT|nr:(S)-ureidoglycine aminohydrolase [Silvibacterium bohemicum]MBB6146134.1 (S)-ureidoglycine aminohydrolase [Silvibacterium bohemicum]
MHNLGQTRSVRRPNHSLHTPDAFIRTRLPGMSKASAIVHASPALGASFTQYSAEIEPGGTLGSCSFQRFFYVLEGEVHLDLDGDRHTLVKDGYAYLPQDFSHSLTAAQPSRLAVIEKRYQLLPGVSPSAPIVASESEIVGQPLMGDVDLTLRALLPDTLTFDFAVNTMTYQPGAALSMVEMHVMEHGLLMLEGGGIYRLDDAWYPVSVGDFIWMGPYCPQWFGAIGKTPAKYLIYKDWNRHPLG